MSLPYRFREDSFRKYESVILEITNSIPRKSIFTTGLSPVTFACRLRDAMRSLSDNRWETQINMEKFLKWHPQIMVSEQADGSVAVGTRESLKTVIDDAIAVFIPNTDNTTSNEVIRVANLNEARILAELASFRLLVKKVRISNLSDEDAKLLEETYDCRIDKVDAAIKTII